MLGAIVSLSVVFCGRRREAFRLGGPDQPRGQTPIYNIDGTPSSANDGAGTATDGRAISFTYQQGGALIGEAISDGWTDGNGSVAIDGTRGFHAYR